MDKNYYKILGVSKNATEGEIKKAYREMALKFHPDRNQGDKKSEETFKEIVEAHDVLTDPTKRKQYDKTGYVGNRPPQAQQAEPDFGNLKDFFDTFFGGNPFNKKQNNPTGPRKGNDIKVIMEIPFRESVLGATKEITLDIPKACDVCSGSGNKPSSSSVICNECSGTGMVFVVKPGEVIQRKHVCQTCKGLGSVQKDPCDKCKGAGKHKNTENVKIKIPAGIQTGQELRLTGKGDDGYFGGPKGDLYIVISVLDDPEFRRDRDDLITFTNVDAIKAMLGGNISVKTLEGSKNVYVSKGTQNNSEIVIKGEGVPRLKTSGRGDLKIRVNIVIPNVTDTQADTLRQVFNS